MAKNNFSNWQLSSSENEDETQGILLKVKRKKSIKSPQLDTSNEEYVPLLQRLKMQRLKSNDFSFDGDDDDDELPAFNVRASCDSKNKSLISPLRTEALSAKRDVVLVGDDLPVFNVEASCDSKNKSLISPLRTETLSTRRNVVLVDDELPVFDVEASCDLKSKSLISPLRTEALSTKRNVVLVDDDLPVFNVESSCDSKNKSPICPLRTETLLAKRNVVPCGVKDSNLIPNLRKKMSPAKRKIDDVIVIDDDVSADISKKTEKFSRKNVASVHCELVEVSDKPRRILKECSQKVTKDLELPKRTDIKLLKPEECMKYIECMISPRVVDMFKGSDFLKEMKEDFEASCVVQSFATPCVRWRRKVNSGSEVEGQAWEQRDEPEMLVVISAEEFVKMVDAQVGESVENVSLTDFVGNLKSQNRGVNIHLVCCELEKYQRTSKSKRTREQKKREKGGVQRRRKTPSLPVVSPDQIEEALVDLQIARKTAVFYAEKRDELVRLIKQQTKSVAEAPYKRLKRRDVQFINETPSVKINAKTGDGLKKAWKQMIQQFHNVTPVVATAIVDKYPSVISLVQAYEECGADVSKAESLLAGIPVRRGVGTLQTKRRVGPELSYKLYRFLMSTGGDESLY